MSWSEAIGTISMEIERQSGEKHFERFEVDAGSLNYIIDELHRLRDELLKTTNIG